MKISALYTAAAISACILHVACAGLPDAPPAGGDGGACAESEAGEALSEGGEPSCLCDIDCFISDCSLSRCVDGVCSHEQIEDGTTCLDPDWGYGACESSTCVVDP
jgi:hypothetical protein